MFKVYNVCEEVRKKCDDKVLCTEKLLFKKFD